MCDVIRLLKYLHWNFSLIHQYFKSLIMLLVLSYSSLTSANEHENSRQQLEQALADHNGKVIYLDFWASWCVPCRKSFPWMNTVQAKYADQGFKVISVNLDANYDLAQKFLQENPSSFSVIYDPKGKIAKHFAIQGMPSSMLIDRSGQIKYTHTGFFTKKIKQYETEISLLLKEK